MKRERGQKKLSPLFYDTTKQEEAIRDATHVKILREIIDHTFDRISDCSCSFLERLQGEAEND